MHDLTIDLLPGYGGLVLRREGNDAVNPVVGDTPVANIKGKSRAKPTGKASSTRTKGKGKEEEQQKQTKKLPPRLTQSSTLSKSEAIPVEEEPAQEAEDEIVADAIPTLGDDDGVGDEEVPNEHPIRRPPMPNSLPSHCGTKIDPWIKVGMSIVRL